MGELLKRRGLPGLLGVHRVGGVRVGVHAGRRCTTVGVWVEVTPGWGRIRKHSARIRVSERQRQGSEDGRAYWSALRVPLCSLRVAERGGGPGRVWI